MKNYILLENIVSKNLFYTIKIYLQFSSVEAYLKCSTDTPNLNKHKYKIYNITEMYVNRLSTTA